MTVLELFQRLEQEIINGNLNTQVRLADDACMDSDNEGCIFAKVTRIVATREFFVIYGMD